MCGVSIVRMAGGVVLTSVMCKKKDEKKEWRSKNGGVEGAGLQP
jgi:hypothetical protein